MGILTHQDLPLHLGKLILNQGGHKDNQGPPVPLDSQGKMGSREARAIQVREDLRDFQGWMEKLEPKERRVTLELAYQALLACLGHLDPSGHTVYLMEQMPWVLGMKT